ncbi:MAG: DNA repair protein RadC [Candidatus Brocadiaceae bacterium]|nr:DNA repair protein RadC [Candidatus Brocadiaceae bacterium]
MDKFTKTDHIRHRKRIKEKYKSCGTGGWLDYEVLEFALTYAVPRKDTKPIAKSLLSQFKTISGVMDADRKELEKIQGISEHTALFLTLLKNIAIRYIEQELYEKDLISSPETVYKYLKTSLKGASDEEFKAVFLNTRNRLLAIETMHTGTVNKSVIYPRKVVERALHHHATGVIIAHNHPGESLDPSADDCRATKAIKNALNAVEISLLDHIIIGGNSYFSFRENSVEL